MSRRQIQSKLFLYSALLLSCCNSFFYSPHCRSSPWSMSATNFESITDFESMTVKDLRSLLQSLPMERGTLSKLKRKKDMIEYLKQHQSSLQQQTIKEPSEVQQAENDGENQPQTSLPLISRNFNNTEERNQARIGNMPPLEQNNYRHDDSEDGAPAPKMSKWNEFLNERYPPLRDLQGKASTALGDTDFRQIYHPMMSNLNPAGDMDLITVGTASCVPGTTRGVSCTALRLQMNERVTITNEGGKTYEAAKATQGTWLFDVGESTQLQAQRTSRIRVGKISKIFLTHNHGDHTFGLPGVLCLMGQNLDRENAPPIDIYGPAGLRMWLRIAIRYSVSRIVPPYRVHELHDVPYSPDWWYDPRTQRYRYSKSRIPKWKRDATDEKDPFSWTSHANNMPLELCSKFNELEGGRDIYPDYNHPLSYNGAPVWEVCDEDSVKVYAAPMSHTIPCVGYVVKENNRPGRLNNKLVGPIVKRNFKALLEAGFKNPMKAMAVIKNLPEGAAFTFPDGTVVHQHEAVSSPRLGRKVVICGDTSDASALTNLGENADVLVHEATNSYIDFFEKKEASAKLLERDTIRHGHSTPEMAAQFARAIGAKKLVLTHFSARYKGDAQFDAISVMTIIEKIALKAAGMRDDQVVAAWDFMSLPISSHD